MKVSVLNRLFTISALWDLLGHIQSQGFDTWCEDCEHGRCFVDQDRCGPGTAMRREIARRDAEADECRARIGEIASSMGGMSRDVFAHIKAAFTLSREDSREGRRAARIMRKSYARAS